MFRVFACDGDKRKFCSSFGRSLNEVSLDETTKQFERVTDWQQINANAKKREMIISISHRQTQHDTFNATMIFCVCLFIWFCFLTIFSLPQKTQHTFAIFVHPSHIPLLLLLFIRISFSHWCVEVHVHIAQFLLRVAHTLCAYIKYLCVIWLLSSLSCCLNAHRYAPFARKTKYATKIRGESNEWRRKIDEMKFKRIHFLSAKPQKKHSKETKIKKSMNGKKRKRRFSVSFTFIMLWREYSQTHTNALWYRIHQQKVFSLIVCTQFSRLLLQNVVFVVFIFLFGVLNVNQIAFHCCDWQIKGINGETKTFSLFSK